MSENPYRSSDSYFGAMREKRPGVLVFMAGVVTMAVTCLVEHMLEKYGINLMGFYWRFIPVGAMIVGFVAGSGYLLLAWFSGVRIPRRLYYLIGAIQFAGYACAKYLAFVEWSHSHPGAGVTFIEYYDACTQAAEMHHVGLGAGAPMGVFGYIIQLIEIAGFVGGGVIATASLKGAAYCEECQLYKRRQVLALIPAGRPLKKVKRRQSAQADLASTYADVAAMAVQHMAANVQSGDANALAKLVQEHGVTGSTARNFLTYMEIRREYCPGCNAGEIVAFSVTGKTSAFLNQYVKRKEIARANQSGQFWDEFVSIEN